MLSNFRVQTWLVTQRSSDEVNMRGALPCGDAMAGAPAISVAKDHLRILMLARIAPSFPMIHLVQTIRVHMGPHNWVHTIKDARGKRSVQRMPTVSTTAITM